MGLRALWLYRFLPGLDNWQLDAEGRALGGSYEKSRWVERGEQSMLTDF